jgi:ribosomal protein L7/L12
MKIARVEIDYQEATLKIQFFNQADVDIAFKRLTEENAADVKRELDNRLIDIIRRGDFIQAIKEYRAATGLGLKESKEYCDKLRESV